MKEFIKRITVILILMMMFLNNSFLLIISTAIDEIERIIDETNINVLQNIVLEKYVNYNTESTKGVLTQFNLKTGIEYVNGEQYAPLGSTGILLNIPKIDDEFPEKVEVVGKSTKATNGSDTAKDFRYIYNKDTGELKLAVVNQEDDDGNIYSENVNGARDEYTIICYYSENCYNDSKAERNLELSGFVQANIQNEIETRKRAEVSESWQVAENISGLISTNVETTEIYNGYIESNIKNETEYETEYIENLEIEFSIGELCDEVHLVTDNNFVNTDNKLNDKDKIIYKSTKIDKNKVMDLLGDNGYLQILNLNGDILGELNKDTEVGENGVYEIIYQDEINNILIKTSKIDKIGAIVLQNTKNIKSSMLNLENTRIYSENSINCFNNIEIVNEEIQEEVQELQEETVEIEQKEIYNYSNENIIDIKQAESKIDLSIDKSEWTNKMQNDVEFNIKFIANNMSCRLFENPIIEIRLPNEVEKVILKQDYLLYSEGLKIEDIQVIEDNGKLIRVELSGRQQEYYNIDMIDGAEFVIPATIILKKDIDSINTKIELKSINGQEQKDFEYDINIVSSNFQTSDEIEEDLENAQNNEQQITNDDLLQLSTEITATLGEKVLEEGQEIHEHEFVRYNIKIKNNSDSKMEGLQVIGNIPDGMVYIKSYFGELSHNENDRYITEEDKTITEYKEIIDLEPDEEKYIYYWTRVNLLEDGQIEKNIQSDIKIQANEKIVEQYILNTTAKKAEMEVKVNARETRRAENVWIYDVKVTNRTNSDLTNVVVNMDLQNEMKFSHIELPGYSVTETDTGLRIDVPVIEANSTKKLELFIQITRLDDSELDFEVQAYVSAQGDNTDLYYSNFNREKVYTAGISVVQTSEKEGQELKYDEEVEYEFVIKNISNENVSDKLISLNIMSFIDENLVPISADYEYFEYSEENSMWQKAEKSEDISQKYVEDGIDENTIADLYITTAIPQGEEINLKIKCKAGEVYEKTEVRNSLKIMYEYCGEHSVTSNIIKNTILPNEIDNPEDDKPNDDEKPGEDDGTDNENPGEGDKPGQEDIEIEQKYSINGFAWEDINKNGKYEDGENKLSNIIVKLFNAETNSIVKNDKGKNLEVKTNNNGEYKFNDIIKGKYLVLFEYDNDTYSPTIYKKDMVSEDKNSDVIKKQVAIDGVEKTVAVTDMLNLKNSNLGYINIGLVKNERFDLSLNKSISKVILKYDGFNKEYVYNQLKLAKVEIPSKKINGASIEVEYLLEIKNEGDVSGYVEQIADYLLDGFEFDTKLNEGWSISGKQTLKNSTYSGIVIKPGESKVVKLYLTRKLSSDSIGTLTNKAEIIRSISINGNLDIDSVNGNKVQNEDDYSYAELIIGVKTGATIYSSIIILMLIVIMVLRLLISKKLINIKKISIFGIGVIIILSGFISDKTYSGGEDSATYTKWSNSEAKTYIENNYTPSSSSLVGCYYSTVRKRADEPEPSSYDWIYEWTDTVTGYMHYTSTGVYTETTETKCSLPFCPNTETTMNVAMKSYHTAHNYVHYGGSHSDGQLYCSEGGEMSNNSASPYKYEYSSKSISSISVNEKSKTGLATIFDNGSSPEYKPWPDDSDGDSAYYHVGPYSVTYNGSITGYTVYYKDYDDGQEKSLGDSEVSIVDSSRNSTSISSGGTFYLRVPKKATKITKVVVSVKKTAQITYKVSYRWSEYWKCGVTGAQVLRKDGNGSKEVTVNRESYNSVTLPGKSLPVGKLKIQKKDFDTGDVLKGYKVRVQESKYYYNKVHTIPADKNSITIGNIPADCTYTITEVEAPKGYKLELQFEDDIKKSIKTKKDDTVTVTLRDRMYGNLIVEKIDQDKLEEESWENEDLHELEDLVFSGAKFRIYYIEPDDENQTKKYIRNFVNKTDEPSIFETTEDVNDEENPPDIFEVKVEEGCQFRLDNIPTYYNYYIEEIELSDDMLQYYDVSTEPQMVQWSDDMLYYVKKLEENKSDGKKLDDKELIKQCHGRNLRSNAYGDMWFGFTNKQLRIDIEGYVWEDIATSKLTVRDNLYNDKNENVDKRIPNIPVYLKKNGVIKAVRYTDTNGEYFFPAKSTYNADGTGDEYTIVIEELSQYLIEFEYNGLKYQCVPQILEAEKGSKVAEEDKNDGNTDNDRRTIFNNNYYNISNVTKKDNENKGKTETGVELTYSNGGKWNSELVQNTDYYSTSLEGDVKPTSSAIMYADTETARDKTSTEYILNWKTGRRVIRNINLGIYEREQPDLAIVTDLEDIDLTINGYSHKYEYKNRAKYVQDGVPDDIINENYDALLDGFSVGVKNSNNHNYNMSYTREIYDSYIAYNKNFRDNNDAENENRLRVFVRYKIVVKNESSSLLSKVSLKNYADSSLEFAGSEYVDAGGSMQSLNWTGETSQSGSIIKTSDEIPIYIEPGKCITVYIRYELNKDTIVRLSTLDTSVDTNTQLDLNKNVTEIMEYSTFRKEENGDEVKYIEYGGIDKDSAPDNINYDIIDTYEDDTDAAPGLAFKKKGSKLISGLVFEDKTSKELLTNQERRGSTKYEDGEKGVANVDVQMMNKDGSSVIKLYNLDDTGKVVVTNAQDLTDENGKYEFTGIVPGEYYLQYTYGYYNRVDSNSHDTEERVQTKIGNVNVTTESYKSTIIDTENAYIMSIENGVKKGLKTLIDNNKENRNGDVLTGYNVIEDDYKDKNSKGEPENALWYWYQKKEPDCNYSSAVDEMKRRKEINDALDVVDYNVKANYEKVNPATDEPQYIQSIKAYTGYMDFPIEDTRDQTLIWDDIDGKAKNSREYEIKFGIVERPRQSVQVNKEISYIKLTLADGRVLLEGDPREPNKINYVTYPDGGILKIEVDNEIIEGSTLDIRYDMSIENISEIDYCDYDEDDIVETGEFKYYRYGDATGLLPVKLTLNSIVDYADEKLSFTYDIDRDKILYYSTNKEVENKWLLVENALAEENQLAGVNIHNVVYKNVKHRKNLLVMNLQKDFEIGYKVEMDLSAKKLLTDLVDTDQVFNNHVEILKMGNVVGRFYGELQDNGIWKVDTPGNFNPQDIENTTEGDNNDYIRAQVTVVPATGVETIIMYSALGVICLTILAGGIIFIKKKVLD